MNPINPLPVPATKGTCNILVPIDLESMEIYRSWSEASVVTARGRAWEVWPKSQPFRQISLGLLALVP